MNKKIYLIFIIGYLFSRVTAYGQCNATYASLPYLQGFESTWINNCNTDDAPDANWLNTPATGNNSWRQYDDGTTASWTGPNGYLYTPGGSNANGASSSYSACFHSSYADHTTGMLDLYLDLSTVGTKQITYDYINTDGTDGMGVLISTNGTAGPFTLLDSVSVSTVWETRTLTTNATGATCVLRFRATGDYGNTDIGVDNIAVSLLPACTGAPTAGIATPTTVNLTVCNPSQTFTLSGSSTGVSGITYQWQQSTDGINYTSIPGATDISYAGGAFTAPVTYLNCLVTCIASNQSTLSNTDTVNDNSAGTPLPWTEGFETIGNDQQLPGCWTVAPAGVLGVYEDTWANEGDENWFSFLPSHTGNGLAGFWYYANNDFFFTPGFSLTAGTTYQFSYWYVADGFGGTVNHGEYNAYLWYGTSATTAAMTNSIGSVLNFNNTTYTQFIGTFTPATSGIYYIGINAQNSTNGNNYDAWAFDDVALTALVPCSGTPPAGAASPSNVSLSPCNPTQTLTLSDVYAGIGGLTYQWQQSTDGINYTPIPGATNNNYTGGPYTVPVTYINCLVTCTNSGLSALSSTDTINFTPQAYTAVTSTNPYIQGFESQWINKCNTDDAPDAYWINTPATGDNSWRQYGDGTTASWDAPNDYLYSPGGSDANGASSTYSATFHGSYTIQTGAFDLYLDLSAPGIKQISYDYINPDGDDNVAVLISTTGPAGPFTLLDSVGVSANWETRTLTTATTSNICVLRFQGTGDGGSSDIGVDNVAVTILTPCNGTPTAGTATPANSNLSVCNPTQTFTVAGNYAGLSGITYQWQQSTDGINYTSISGATGTSYTGGPFTTSVTYINCLVTCTNSGLSSPSNADTVNIVPQGYFAVTSANSYTQGFENQWINRCDSDDAPDAYWLGTYVTGNHSWRRDDDGASADWTSLNGGYMPAGSDASLHSARYHSFNSAVAGPFDLYLDLSATGTKQVSYDFINVDGTDSLKVSLSTNGPAGPFIPMDSVGTSATWATRTFTTAATSNTCVLRFQAIGDFSGDVGLDNVSASIFTGCTGAPTAGVAIPSSSTLFLCNPSQTFALTGYTGVGGLTYQWQQSTDGINFTTIPNATTTNYTDTFASGTITYLNCLVTCTNSGETVLSNVDTVVVGTQQYYPVTTLNSYTQGFESPWLTTCYSDDVPDAYWTNTPGIGENSWRQSGNGATADWDDPTASLYTPLGSNANGASSSNSATFHKSFTQFATGDLDLHLDLSALGTKKVFYDYINQSGVNSSGNMTVLLSTNGDAGPFTQVDTAFLSANWETKSFLTTATSNKCVLRFHSQGDNDYGTGNGNDIGLDNVDVIIFSACTGTPVAGTFTTTQTLDCIPYPANLTVSNDLTVTETGIVYQWQSSTDSINWTNIPGATDITYTANVTATTYYRFTVTCTASGDVDSSAGIKHTLTPEVVSIATLPYFQGFESWVGTCYPDDRPDSNWAGIPTTSDSSWRRDDQGASADWSTATGAYSPASTEGVHSARFHSTGTALLNVGNLDLHVNLNVPGTKTITFDYNNDDGDDRLTVELSEDGINFTTIGTYYSGEVAGTTGWLKQTITTTSVAPNAIIRFSGLGDYEYIGAENTTDIGLDSVYISLPPLSCDAITGLAVNGVTSTGATITWNSVTGTQGYEYVVGTSSAAPASGTGTPNATYAATGLTSNTTYYVFVRDSCGSNNFSAWDTLSFTTGNLGIAIVNGGFDIDAYPNPAKDVITIQVYGMKGENRKVSLTDIAGRVISTADMLTDRVDFNMSNLAAGIYLVRYEDDAHARVIKVNKQ